MKVYVDEFPKEPKDCLFAKFNCEYGHICQFSKKKCTWTGWCEFLLSKEAVE